MKLGLAMFPTHYAVRPAELGRIAEENGFESLFLPEHTHIPASRRSPYPGGGELPREYSHTYDPFVALATVAEATERIKPATGICLVVERDPITTAKEVASLDHLSDGRFLFGVGAGWNRDEMARRVEELQEKAAQAGRGEIPVTGSAAPRDPGAIERLAEIGFHRLVWYVRPEPRDQVAPKVEKLARLVREAQVA